MNLAVVEVTGKQYIVTEGDIIETDRLPFSVGEGIKLDRVLLFWDGQELKLGQPYLEGFSVAGEITAAGRGPKVIAYKFKRRKDYHRKVGHRQAVFQVRVKEIAYPGMAPKPVAPEIAPEGKPEAARRTAEKKAPARKAKRKKPAKAEKKRATGK